MSNDLIERLRKIAEYLRSQDLKACARSVEEAIEELENRAPWYWPSRLATEDDLRRYRVTGAPVRPNPHAQSQP